MKKILVMLLLVCLVFSFASCGATNDVDDNDIGQTEQEAFEAFRADFEKTSAIAVNARVETFDDGSKMLMADVKNNSANSEEISEIVISFAAWDENGTFVTIKTPSNPNNFYDVFEATVDEVTISAGETWVADKGLTLAEDCYNIKYVEAIVCTCKIGENSYNNPLYDAWKETYTGNPLKDWMKREEPSTDDTTNEPELSREERFPEFKSNLEAQTVLAVDPKFDDELDNDDTMLVTNLKSTHTQTIKDISVAFVAWDGEGNPVMIKGKSGSSEDSYIKIVSFGDVTLESGQTWLADNGIDVTGYSILNDNIVTVEAVVVSYTNEDGTEWDNPLYSEWAEFFGGNKLESWMKPADSAETTETPDSTADTAA